MKRWVVALSFVITFSSPGTEALAWAPSPEHTQVPIWPVVVPDAARTTTVPETATETSSLIAGRTLIEVSNVSQPTMTVYSPKGRNTGAAVIIFPGGGYEILAIDLEGTEVCDWLTSKGITCVLLKYRVPSIGPYRKSPTALEDAQRTVGLVRLHASEWNIDPHKIGVLGFSAGGHLAATLSTNFNHRGYAALDAADRESCRPDFAVLVYPWHLAINGKGDKKFVLNKHVPANKETPPTFLLQSEDDRADNIEHSLQYYFALKNAGVPVEMHLYAQGGHGFGLRPTSLPVTRWPQLVETWLETIGMTPQ